MARILVVYHSETGHTARMAELVADGAREAGAEVDLKKVDETSADELTGTTASSPARPPTTA